LPTFQSNTTFEFSEDDWQPDVSHPSLIKLNIKEVLTAAEYNQFMADVKADIALRSGPKWKRGDQMRYRYVGKELQNRLYWEKIYSHLSVRWSISQPGKTKLMMMMLVFFFSKKRRPGGGRGAQEYGEKGRSGGGV
jgi:hypothetical protein